MIDDVEFGINIAILIQYKHKLTNGWKLHLKFNNKNFIRNLEKYYK